MDMQDKVSTTDSGVETIRFSFLSQDGVTQINARMWVPVGCAGSEPEKVSESGEGVEPSKDSEPNGGVEPSKGCEPGEGVRPNEGVKPKAIVQIVHGMEEHINRYEGFARFLAGQGFVVGAADMLGHGQSIASPELLSCIPAENGKTILIEDVHELRSLISEATEERFSQQLPFFMFGHSMGSFIVRAYITYHTQGLAGAILCGSGQQPILLSKIGNTIAKRITKSKGETYKSDFLEGLGAGAYAKKIKNARTDYDWLCTDEAIVDAYIADPLCGVPFSAGAYVALTDITAEIATAANAAKVPRDLPILFIAGSLDPVGANGAGVQKAASLLKNAGVRQVDVVLYTDMRHEVLNETGKKDVYAGLASWMTALSHPRQESSN
ncbi:MAG: lysophospholipase [Coriobacteriia bacterium]|nr:lysophospholipase [Coriobacteriia bacterium]